jgi:Right handed beta helix region
MSVARRKILLGITSLSAAALLGRVAEATVWNGEELRHALATLGRGSCIRLKPGYDYGGVGGLVVDTEDLLIEGEGPDCTVRDGMVVRASGVVISAAAYRSGVTVNGAGTIVRGCDFSVGRGDMLHINASATGTEVTGCTFHDASSGTVAAISVGVGQTSANTRVGARIHNNTFRNLAAGSTETVYMKSSGNTVASNSLTNSNNITCRCGSNNVISGNTTSGGYGIVVQDNDNHVIGNRVLSPKKGKGIFIMAGDAPYTSNVQGIHAQACNTEVSGNTGPLMIGKQYGSRYTFPALNTRVSGHSGPITHMREQGTTLS